MHNLYLELSAYGGSSVGNTCEEAIEVADKLGIDVWIKFNGVRLVASPGKRAGDLVSSYYSALSRNAEQKKKETP